MTKLQEIAGKAAARTKRVVAEMIGDGKLDEQARQQEKSSEDKDKDDSNLAKITNNLT
jgi:hypothetical protein